MSQERATCQRCGGALRAGHVDTVCAACQLGVALSQEESGVHGFQISTGNLVGDYEIVRRLGIGGMGVVYEARQRSLKRSVALKMIRAPSSASSKDIVRFRQEAEAAARLSHPNIIEVYEAGEFEGNPYFTMRYLEKARPLAVEIKQGPCEPSDAARLIRDIALAVGYAHRHGVIHRDITPSNILLDPNGRAYLVDFGLAKFCRGNASQSGARSNEQVFASISDDGQLVGTPYYMSPEQVAGGDLTTSTDIYSLGAVLYELLSGAPPFRARTINETLNAIVHLNPKPLAARGSKIDRDLQVICEKCLRKEPGRRYATAEDLANELDRWLNGEPIVARSISKTERLLKWVRRHPGAAFFGTAAVVTTIAAVCLLWLLLENYRNQLIENVRGPLREAIEIRTKNYAAGKQWEALDRVRAATDQLDHLPADKRVELRRALQNEMIADLSLIDLRASPKTGDSWRADPDLRGLVRLNPDFTLYASSRANDDIELRSLSGNDVVERFPADGPAKRILFSADGQKMAASTLPADGGARLTVWNLANGRELWNSELDDPDAFDFEARGGLILARQGRLALMDSTTGKVTRTLAFQGKCEVLRVDSQGERLATILKADRRVVIIDLEAGVETGRMEGISPTAIDWNPRGRWLAIACSTGQMMVWDTSLEDHTPDRIRTFESLERAPIQNVAWHPRGVLVAGAASGQIHLWHAARGGLEVTWTGDCPDPQFSGDGSRFGPILEGQRAVLLEVAEGRVCAHAKGHPGKIHGAWWEMSGRVFASAGDDGVRLWNHRGFELAYLREAGAKAVVFMNQMLATASESGITLRSLTGVRTRARKIWVGPPVRLSAEEALDADAAILPALPEQEVEVLLAAAQVGKVKLYRSSQGIDKQIASLDSLPGTDSVDISDDGQWLAAGTASGSKVRLWNASKPGVFSSRSFDDIEVGSGARVHFYQDPLPGGHFWFVAACTREFRFWRRVGAEWKLEKSIPTNNRTAARESICFSPRTPVFAISEDKWFRVYLLRSFELAVAPEFDSQRPITFSPTGTDLMTADLKTYLHLWDLPLLRTQLAEMGLDLDLPPFPTGLAEPPLIEEAAVMD